MNIEEKFKEVENLAEFREIATRSEIFLTKEKIKTLSRLISEVNEDSADYDELLSEIEKLNSQVE